MSGLGVHDNSAAPPVLLHQQKTTDAGGSSQPPGLPMPSVQAPQTTPLINLNHQTLSQANFIFEPSQCLTLHSADYQPPAVCEQCAREDDDDTQGICTNTVASANPVTGGNVARQVLHLQTEPCLSTHHETGASYKQQTCCKLHLYGQCQVKTCVRL
jgi:hypothetical protein